MSWLTLSKKLFQVQVYGYSVALLHMSGACLEGLVGASIRSESITRFAHLRVEYGGEFLHKGLLYQSVYRRWYAQLPPPAVWLGDAHSLYLLWTVAAVEQLLSQFCHVSVKPSLQFFHGHAVYPRGSLVAFHSLACKLKIVAVCYVLEYALLPVQFLPPRRERLLLPRWRSCGGRTLAASKWAHLPGWGVEVELHLV